MGGVSQCKAAVVHGMGVGYSSVATTRLKPHGRCDAGQCCNSPRGRGRGRRLDWQQRWRTSAACRRRTSNAPCSGLYCEAGSVGLAAYVVDGLVEDVVTSVSRPELLSVIARNSSFTQKGRAARSPDEGHDVGTSVGNAARDSVSLHFLASPSTGNVAPAVKPSGA